MVRRRLRRRGSCRAPSTAEPHQCDGQMHSGDRRPMLKGWSTQPALRRERPRLRDVRCGRASASRSAVKSTPFHRPRHPEHWQDAPILSAGARALSLLCAQGADAIVASAVRAAPSETAKGCAGGASGRESGPRSRGRPKQAPGPSLQGDAAGWFPGRRREVNAFFMRSTARCLSRPLRCYG
jgi:hypothetical protein